MEIELRHLHKRFGAVHANNDISVLFRAGRIVGILGENGAGKSTLMKILSGYQPPDAGELLIDGRGITRHAPLAAIANGIGMLQQDPLDIPAFSVIENFVYGRPGMALGTRAAKRELATIAGRFGFALDPEAPAASLTIGQRQQLEIVRLLSLGIRTLILDEPTTGISAEQKTILFDALRRLAHEDGLIILLVSHKLEDVIALCDEAIVLRGGRLVGGAAMPTTAPHLVSLMFGQALAPLSRDDAPIGDPVLRFHAVTLRGKRVTIERFSWAIRAGEVVGLAGLDGSGQELILRASVGLIAPDAGRVELAGANMTGKPYRAYLRAGAAFGGAGRLEEGLIAGLTLTEHAALIGEGARIDWRAARESTQASIARYGVRGTPDSPIEALSGGNQQRVLMSLLAEQPRVLVLEQPMRGLDVESARGIWAQVLARRAGGTAIVFSSPELDEIVTYSDRIFVAYAGRIVEVPDARRATIEALGRMIGGDFSAMDTRERPAMMEPG